MGQSGYARGSGMGGGMNATIGVTRGGWGEQNAL